MIKVFIPAFFQFFHPCLPRWRIHPLSNEAISFIHEPFHESLVRTEEFTLICFTGDCVGILIDDIAGKQLLKQRNQRVFWTTALIDKESTPKYFIGNLKIGEILAINSKK
jgi:hypothetical protein